MHIFGYDENKHMIEVDLPIETVVAEQIDPWRLDLFDPDPVIYAAGNGTPLRFRRLDDVAFAYKLKEKAVICASYGRETVCLEGAVSGFKSFNVHIREVRQSKSEFSEHLKRLFTLTRKSPNERDLFAYPRQTKNLRIMGNSVLLDSNTGMFQESCPIFTGKMAEMVPLTHSLSPAINWVFTTFADIEPIVSGNALSGCLTGARPERVEVWIDQEQVRQFVSLLRRAPAVSEVTECFAGDTVAVEFTYNGMSYRVHSSKADRLSVLKNPGPVRDGAIVSSDCAFAVGVDQIYASRIALFDLSRRKHRAVSLYQQDHLIRNKINIDFRQMPDGFSWEMPESLTKDSSEDSSSSEQPTLSVDDEISDTSEFSHGALALAA